MLYLYDSIFNTRIIRDYTSSTDKLQTHYVLALREPRRHPTENTTVTHPTYHLVFPSCHKGRACIYISKSLVINKWRKERVSEESQGDITSISIDTGLGKIWIHNCQIGA